MIALDKRLFVGFLTFFLPLATLCLSSCDDDKEDLSLPNVTPTSQGSFVDERDGYEYHWVRIGGLDWCTENSHYNLNDETHCRFYIDYSQRNESYPDDMYSEKYGYLYTQTGAQRAVPSGWRLPTDDDWKQLEQALGMSTEEASAREWRGTTQAYSLIQKEEGTRLAMQFSGYYNPNIVGGQPKSRFLGVYGYYWTSTSETRPQGQFYFYRKILIDKGEIFRESIEPDDFMLAVRFVRNAQ